MQQTARKILRSLGAHTSYGGVPATGSAAGGMRSRGIVTLKEVRRTNAKPRQLFRKQTDLG